VRWGLQPSDFDPDDIARVPREGDDMANRVDVPAGSSDIPGSLNWAYQDQLNRQTDRFFWQQTGYKPNVKLNPADPQDRAMIPKWWAAQAQVIRSISPRAMIRLRAIEKVLAVHQVDPRPLFLHSEADVGAITEAYSDGQQLEKRLGEITPKAVGYIALFNVKDPHWPRPYYETYPAEGAEIEPPSPNVSGDLGRGHYGNDLFAKRRPRGQVIRYAGMVLRPLTTDVVVRLPDLDPTRQPQDRTNNVWIDLDGIPRPRPLFRDIYRPGDAIYYWDGPWGALSGSRGIAIVRDGVVVEAFTTMMS
jgi:hypothetical protein